MQTLFILTICLKSTYITLFILKIIFKSINAHKNHLTNPQTNITGINIFVVINQIDKHKAKIYNHCKYTQIIIKKNYFFSSQSIRMSGNSINFVNKKIKKSDFYNNKNKTIFNIDDIDVNKIIVSKKEQYGKYNSCKYFLGYNDNDVILYMGLSQMTGYINEFDEDKNKSKNKITMSLKVREKKLLKNYNKIWGKKLKD